MESAPDATIPAEAASTTWELNSEPTFDCCWPKRPTVYITLRWWVCTLSASAWASACLWALLIREREKPTEPSQLSLVLLELLLLFLTSFSLLHYDTCSQFYDIHILRLVRFDLKPIRLSFRPTLVVVVVLVLVSVLVLVLLVVEFTWELSLV